MAPHSCTFAWKIPWREEPGGCHPWGRKESDKTERLNWTKTTITENVITITLTCHYFLSFTSLLLSHSLSSIVGEGNGTPLQYSCLENPMDGGTWWPAVHGVAESWTRLSDFTFTFHFHALEKEMATHSSVLAWESQGWGSLVGCRLWGLTESDTTEVT